MELCFTDAKVRDLCSSQDALAHEYGEALARRICCKLAFLEAAPTLACVPSELPIGLIRIGDQGRYAVALGATHHLVFQAFPKETAAMADLAKISKLLIVGFGIGPAAKAAR